MDDATIKTVLMLGRPGSGKGTQAALLAERLGWKTLSSGNIFRELRNGDGALAQKVREEYDKGNLFPTWFPSYLFLDEVLHITSEEGLICEGFSRSVEQAEIFHDALTWLSRDYLVFNLEVSEEVAVRRQVERNKVDARSDSDTPEKIQKRIEEYTAKTEPVIEFFRAKGTLIQLDGEKTPEEIAAQMLEKLQRAA